VPTLIFAGIAAVALRHLAARRVLARQGRFVWLMFIPNVFVCLVFLWAALQAFSSNPLWGALMMIAGVICLALIVRLLTTMSRRVTATGPQEDITAAIMEPLADHMLSVMAFLLIGALVALVGLIMWAVSQAAR
jgi:ABC-type xylose transport system permease subunit